MAEFRMPSLGADMETGTITEWLVKPGDTIAKGDPIAVIDTDKATIEVESFHSGVVTGLLVGLDQRVPVGTPLAVITEAAQPPSRTEPGPIATPPTPEAPPPATPSAGVPPSPVLSPLVRHLAAEQGVDLAAVPGTGPGGKVTRADVIRATPPAQGHPPRDGREAALAARLKASPLARRLASELGVDLATVTPTGRTGAIRAQDVRHAATGRTGTIHSQDVRRAATGPTPEPRPSPPDAAERRNGARQATMRQAIARAMSRSKREIPHYYLTQTTDMSTALAWLRDRNRDLPVSRRILPAAVLLKATALAASEVPELNGFWTDDRFVPGEAVHLGVAISLRGGGLIAPALHDAARLGLADLMAGMKDLVLRARGGRLRGTEMTEATITATNLGEQGVESVHGVIYPPQVALAGFGRITERPWAVNGLLGVRPLVTVTLAADHRATDGYTGARFLTAVDRLLNHPEEL
ncbi:pyruvate dehydrogenase complex dihydrolipoamide acetyltransferase [Nonomuraea maheshkhaliensis]|uniref:Dihydrolipoamide acetyltransferase component of pyruvate dehydrogenase complex n=1 Tax=Nonomuraea maheshkhaliensis TaxID=419590 RepID=A0ABN2FNZ3_9ACTN